MSDHHKFVVGLRALRDYQPAPLTAEALGAILEAARWTGSSKNLQNWSFVVVQDEETKSQVAACGNYTVPLQNAPAAIVLVKEPGGNDFDIGRAAQNIMLAAAALGVASCPTTLHRSREAADVLGLGSDRSCRYAIALGYPAEGAAPRMKGGRKPLDELVHWDTY